jgi:RNA polymerase primary sigma factor
MYWAERSALSFFGKIYFTMKRIDSKNIVRTVADNKQSFNKYLVELRRTPLLSSAEEVDLFKQFKAGDKSAEQKIIKANLLFVVTVAKQYSGLVNKTSLTLEDLVSEGNLGLVKAVHRFEPARGFKFISYAVFWIKQAILDCLQHNIKTVRLPNSAQLIINKALKAEEQVEHKTERCATFEEIAEIVAADPAMLDTKVTASRIREVLTANRWEKSLNQKIDPDSNDEFMDKLESGDSTDSDLLDLEKEAVVKAMLQTVKGDGRLFIIKHYGLDGHQPTAIKTIAAEFECSAESVRLRIKSAFEQIKRNHKDKLRYFKPAFKESERKYVPFGRDW